MTVAKSSDVSGASERRVVSSWPRFEPDELAATQAVLASGAVNYWTGREGVDFEDEFARFVGRRHAIAVANGTLALEGALLGLGVGPGDDVVVPARTFIATASAVVARGGRPIPADCDRDSGNVTAETIEEAVTARTRGVIVVHLGGWPCEMDEIMRFCDSRNLFLLEDCSQAHGAEYRGKRVGSFGSASTFSFCQDKIMTTAGEGGMVVTDDDEIFRSVVMYKDHGKDPDAMASSAPSPAFKWVHSDFGSNWRLTEIQSAVGRIQLRKLPTWLDVRQANAAALRRALHGVPGLRVPWPAEHLRPAWYKFYAHVVPHLLRRDWNRDRILVAVRTQGMPVFGGSCSEIYREEAFVRRGWQPDHGLTAAHELGDTSLMFQVDPTLNTADMERVADVVRSVMSRAADG